jgi:hypothetical protein
MIRLLIPLAILAALAGALITWRRSRERADSTPGLHQHPERLDQMLDPTDDA